MTTTVKPALTPSQPDSSWPSSIASGVGSIASAGLHCLVHPIETAKSITNAHYVAGIHQTEYEYDLNPFHTGDAPDVDKALKDQIEKIDRFSPTRPESISITTGSDETPSATGDTEWSQGRTDCVCETFSENSYVYSTALWVYGMTHKEPLQDDKVLVRIVKRATTPDPQTGKKPELWDILCEEFNISAYSKTRAKFYYFLGAGIIKDLSKKATFNIISQIRSELGKNDGRKFAEIFEKSMKKLSSFFEDYIRMIENYSKDPNARGTRDDFIKEKLNGPEFLCDGLGKDYTEDQLYKEFSELSLDKVAPKVAWTDSMQNWVKDAAPTSWKDIRSIVIIVLKSLLCGIFWLPVKLGEVIMNKGIIPYSVRNYLPDQLRGLIQGSAYEHSMNKILIEQLGELMKQNGLGSTETPFINETTRKELQTTVKLILQTLNLEPNKTREELRAHLEMKKQESLLDIYVQKAMEQALEGAMIGLYTYIVDPARMEMILCKSMEVANAPFSDEPHPTKADREATQKELKQLVRKFVEKTVQNAVSNALTGKSSEEKQKITSHFLDNFKINMEAHLAQIDLELKDLEENPEAKENTLEILHHMKQLIETIYNDVHEMDHASTVPYYIKKEVKGKIDPIVRKQDSLLNELNRIKLRQEKIEKHRELQEKLTQIETHIQHIEAWKEERWVAALSQPSMIEQAIDQLPDDFDSKNLVGKSKYLTHAFEKIDQSKKAVKRLDELQTPGPNNLLDQLIKIRTKQVQPSNRYTYSTENVEKGIEAAIQALSVTHQAELQVAIEQVKAATTPGQLAAEVQNLHRRVKELKSDLEKETHTEQKAITVVCEQVAKGITKEKGRLEREVKMEIEYINALRENIKVILRGIDKQAKSLKQESIVNANRALGAGIGGSLSGGAGYLLGAGALASPAVGAITALGAYGGFKVPKEGAEKVGFTIVYPRVMQYFDNFYNLTFNPNIYRGLANNALMLVVDESKHS